MALVRCPSCGRVADGKMCFACGYEWPEGAAPAPPPSSSSPPAPASPSQSFKIGSPASYPTAAVVARTPTPPPASTAEALPPDEIDLDVDFEERRASGTFTPSTAPVFGSAPAFPGMNAPSPSGAFGQPPPAFPSPSGSFGGGPGGFGSSPPAFPSSSTSGAFGSPPPAFGTSPPPAFPSPSGAFGIPSPPSPPTSTLPAVADPWGAPAAPASPPTRPPSMSYTPPPAPQPSWGSNPTVQVPASVASSLLQGLVPAAPAALSGLFDGLNQPGPVTPPPVPPSEDGEINFTLEPGSGVEPSPFVDVVDSVEVDLDRAASSRSLPIDFAEDLVEEAPAPSPAIPAPSPVINVTSGFAELDAGDLDTALQEPPASTAFDPFAAAAPELQAPPRAPAPIETPVVVDESSFADVEAGLADEIPLATNPAPFDPLDGEAAFDALGGLDDLGPVSLDDDASLEALAELDREIAAFEAESPPLAPAPIASSSSSQPATARGPTLSARVGTLAESLEEGGRIADASLLYEVQAVLAAAGR